MRMLLLGGTMFLAGCPGNRAPSTLGDAPATQRATFRWQAAEREFVVHRGGARGTTPDAARSLVVVLHGCTQDAADAARGTRFDDWADRHGFVVLYPEQPARANATRCWNWYVPAEMRAEGGEVGLASALIDSVARAYAVPPRRVALVGLSAGAAMAASLVIANPARYGALAMHSGVPAAAASDLTSALALMRSGPPDRVALGIATARAMGARARAVPVFLVHGSDDRIAAPANLEAMAAQWAVANAAARGEPVRVGMAVAEPRAPATAGHAMHGMRVLDDRKLTSVEWWRIDGLGHAWSGGSGAGSYTSPAAPDATAMIVSFLREVWTTP